MIPGILSESGLINSMFCVGGFVGSLVYGFVVNKIGRIRAFQTITAPQIASFIIVAYAETSSAILLSRLLLGFAAGGIHVTVPIFISEIAQEKLV